MLRPRSAVSLMPTDVQLSRAREVLLAESAALALVADRLNESIAEAIACICDAPGCVLTAGIGKAGLIAQKVAATLASTGTRSHFLHPSEARHGDLGRLCEDDVVLAFSHSGETAELNQILPSVREIGAAIVAVTSKASSQLSQSADVAIAYGPIEEACPIGMAPSTSCAVMLGIGDAIAFVLMQQRDFGPEDFGRYHPAGSLGRQLQRVRDVMRRGDQLRIAQSHLPVREAFVSVQRPGRRSGAICLVDAQGRLEGLFTDSDLAKLLERSDVASLTRPIGEIMTKHPITVSADRLVREVVELFREHQISEIPVVDSSGCLLGLVDITDLVDLLPEAA